jgi:hypothetical protein
MIDQILDSTPMKHPRHREIKPPCLKPRVYLAGKISQHGWREQLTQETVIVRDALDPHETRDFPDFTLTGPFFVACGHGCAHGPATHGQEYLGPGDEARRRVFDANIDRIEHSDFVFAHINELDCFGTLFEIGHAHASGVPVFLNFGPDLTDRQKRELWFSRMACAMVLGELEEAFERTLQIWNDARALNVFGEARHG